MRNLGPVIIALIIICGFFCNYSTTTTNKMDKIYGWCASLEKVRTQLKEAHETERITSVRPEDVANLMEACKKCNAVCTKQGSVEEKVYHHGGNYYKTMEQVTIKFE